MYHVKNQSIPGLCLLDDFRAAGSVDHFYGGWHNIRKFLLNSPNQHFSTASTDLTHFLTDPIKKSLIKIPHPVFSIPKWLNYQTVYLMTIKDNLDCLAEVREIRGASVLIQKPEEALSI